MGFPVLTTSVHATPVAADYPVDRLDEAADEVMVLGVTPPGSPGRDAADAVNVAPSRLAAAPTTETRDGDPVDARPVAHTRVGGRTGPTPQA